MPRGRVPELFALVERLRATYNLRIPSFGHAGDGNIHVNIMIDPADADEVERARQAVGELFAGVVALEGSISGEHGIGFSKAPYLGLELSADVIALMKRVKQAFDPHGILNPGKIFPPSSDNREGTKARRHDVAWRSFDVLRGIVSSRHRAFVIVDVSRWSPATLARGPAPDPDPAASAASPPTR